MSFVESKTEQLSRLIGRARDVVANLTREQLGQRPDPNTWSVIEVIAHMNRTHEPYLHGLESLATRLPEGSTEGKLTFIGRQIELGAGPHGNVPAIGSTIPPKELNVDSELDRWNQVHDALLEVFKACKGKKLEAAKMRNPLMRILRINGADALAIVCSHSERHVRQMEDRAKIVKQR
ncbi:DinB family protein [Kamptonema cortianum]|nr:DinB family protein [Geitlerinema splendidum]MDK3156258.1 DinB family protein [Kamptonema cortianum]